MTDHSVSIHPYFKVKPSCESSFREMCDKMVAKTSAEEGCISYGFSFSGIFSISKHVIDLGSNGLDFGAFWCHFGTLWGTQMCHAWDRFFANSS